MWQGCHYGMNYRIIVSAVIERGGAILLGKKAPGVGPYPDTWHLPGGGVNLEGETPVGAVKREVREETGIEIDDIEPLAFDEDDEPDKRGIITHYVFLVFRGQYVSGVARAADDIIELRWVGKGELAQFPLSRPAMKLFRASALIP